MSTSVWNGTRNSISFMSARQSWPLYVEDQGEPTNPKVGFLYIPFSSVRQTAGAAQHGKQCGIVAAPLQAV
jgi:hypothetical protein